MKIQGLAIIFVIIILPISIIIGEYASTQIKLIQLEQLYDSRLITATHDALKAFQINTFNDASSDIADSKISSIEASANAFYNSMGLSFGLQGYSKEELQKHVPALVYTMYDGYYIYSPYTNIAKTEDGLEIDLDSDNIEYGFKPYVYYSCRYQMGTDSDFIINYSLDNYITVQGIVNGNNVYESGYLVTLANSKNEEGLWLEDGKYYYSGIEILPEANFDEYTDEELTKYLVSSLTDYLVESDGSTKAYKYTKINGTKYYWNEAEEYVFYILGGERIKQATKDSDYASYEEYVNQIKINTNAISYYSSAYEFTNWVKDNLGELETGHTVTKVANSGSGKIFENYQIEYAGSNFNLHRKEVIRYSIESNLSVAIANFNNYTDKTANFQMPKLKETEWELLQNEVSIISFLQGLNLGGKLYNGYTVVTNGKTGEVVKEERIYISTNDGYYHKINDEHLTITNGTYNISDVKSGVLDLDFEIRKDGATGLHYMHKIQLGCYSSIVGQQNVNSNYDSIYEYLQNTNIDSKIKQIYYIALGRERWGTYKIENPSNIQTILGGMDSDRDDDEDTDPLEKLPKITISEKEIYPNAYISSQNPTLKAKIKVESQTVLTNVEYVFSNSQTAPTSGWSEISNDGYYGIAEVSKQVTTTGQWYLYVRAFNAEGEVTKKAIFDIQKDTNPPTITIVDKGADTDTTDYSIEYGYTNVIIAKTITSIDESAIEGEGISGIKAGSGSYNITDPDGNTYNLTDNAGNILPNSGLTFTTENALQIEIAANKVGTWTLTVTIQDNAGNVATETKQYQVTR